MITTVAVFALLAALANLEHGDRVKTVALFAVAGALAVATHLVP